MNDQSESDNPYNAPQAAVAVEVADVQATTLGQIAKRVFLDWEKMRLAYIGILGVFTLLMGWPHLGSLEFWAISIFGGIVANGCYFLGPIVETYVTWLGFRSLALRWVMFALGTMFTMLGAVGALFSISMNP